jgi:predicted small lipoprotein YifL
MRPRPARTLPLLALAALAAAGCGIKGPLTMPEPSENVVIRPGGTPATTEGTAAPATGTATTEETAPAPQPAKPKPDRPPPPPLPSSNPGTGQGG